MGGTDCALPMLWAIDNKGMLYNSCCSFEFLLTIFYF